MLEFLIVFELTRFSMGQARPRKLQDFLLEVQLYRGLFGGYVKNYGLSLPLKVNRLLVVTNLARLQ